MRRRHWLALPVVAAASAGVNALARAQHYAPVLPGRPLVFPNDFGAHPQFRTEWWYLTGWLNDGSQDFGVQITFFRVRTAHDDLNPSRFAPKQLLLAHAALAPGGETRLRHDQRAARTGWPMARYDTADTGLAVDGWQLHRDGQDRYHASIGARDFTLALRFTPAAPPVAQGDAGYSRKGPKPAQASHYYSRPQLTVDGTVTLIERTEAHRVSGRAWLDHEWSSQLLDPAAVGWDWVGLNLHDGSALMAFRIRDTHGGEVWSHARWISASGASGPSLTPRFEALRIWRSPRSGAHYPCAMRVTAGARQLQLEALFDDQELDARTSTGGFYWEGAVRVTENGREVGRGYLELTGYAGALKM